MKGVKEVKDRFTSCVFTLNNYNDLEYNDLLFNDLFSYIIIGKEVGDEGTPHLQGYFELKKQSRFNAIKCINLRMHFEKRKGSQEQAIAYCKKDGVYEENGNRKVQGDRSDLKKITADLSDGKSIRELLLGDGLSYQQLCFAQKAQPYLLKNKLLRRKCIWCYGPTGTGKSHFAKTFAPLDEIYFKKHDTKWWCGYNNEKIVVIDEFRACDMKLSELLILLDDLPYRIEYKGGSTLLQAELIIITTPRSPSDTYINCAEDIAQLMRRVEIKEFCAPVKEVGVKEVAGNTGDLLDAIENFTLDL